MFAPVDHGRKKKRRKMVAHATLSGGWADAMALTSFSGLTPLRCFFFSLSDLDLLAGRLQDFFLVESAVFGMLRSEVCWFVRFIHICQVAFWFMNELDRDGLQDMDYDVMRRVIPCQGRREVWSILHAYNDAVF